MRNISKRTKILAVIIFVTALCGIWLLFCPSRERQAVIDGQYELMQQIIFDIAESENTLHDYPLVYDYEPAVVLLPFYEETQSLYIAEYEVEALYTLEVSEYRALYFQPLPDTAFHSDIHGLGILTIERIDLSLPVAEGADYDTLRIAPARVSQTAQIGEVGNAVIAGHRNYTFGSMFNRLGELELGDIIKFQARSGEKMQFNIFEIAIIEPHDQIAFIQPVNDSIITLYTCTPIRTAEYRLIIRGQKIS